MVLLNKIFIKVEPKTSANYEVERKKELRDKIRAKIDNLLDLQKACKGKRLSIYACFCLWDGSKVEGRAKKDLDNMLKILCDTLKEYMDTDKKEQGLGLIENDNDDLIFEINCSKRLVQTESEEGIELEISEFPQQ